MIVIPKNYSSDLFNADKFIALLEIINALEEDLEYPICSGKQERMQVFELYHYELIKKGYL
jgi:hypothetical protein